MTNKQSLSKRILKYIRNRYPEYINGGTIEKLSMEARFKASNGSRRCREMESGKLSNGKTCPIVLEKEMQGKSIAYRATKPRETVQYKKPDGEVIIINKWD